MPGGGAYRLYFEGKTPWAVRIFTLLLFVNTFFILALDFTGQYFLPKASASLLPCKTLTSGGVQYHAPAVVCWLAERFVPIQFILMALFGVTIGVFRERVHFIPMGSRVRRPVMIAWLVAFVSIIIWVLLSQLGWLR